MAVSLAPLPPGYHWAPYQSTRHAAAIAQLLAPLIATSSVFYRASALSPQECQQWLASKQAAGQPLLIIERDVLESRPLAGFASWQAFRSQDCSQGSLEHSLYVCPSAQGQGLGRALLTALIRQAKEQKAWNLIAAIDSQNQPSLALHQALGFTQVGVLPDFAHKHDQWLTLELWQLSILESRHA